MMKLVRNAFAGILMIGGAIVILSGGYVVAQNVSNYMEQGGARWVIGGSLDVASGGDLDIESGGALKIAGSDRTAALATAPAGVAAGYKIARGETALDGTNPTAAATGLTTIVACSASIKLATAPGVGTSVVTYGTSSGTLNLYGWKVTAQGDATLIASTGTETIGWVCVGT